MTTPSHLRIQKIHPYWCDPVRTWVFDDPAVGLVQEPFVSGIPEMIDVLTRDIPNAREGFDLLFSDCPFLGAAQITWLREEHGGNWYRWGDQGKEGWLCPALFRYFDAAPEYIFIKAI